MILPASHRLLPIGLLLASAGAQQQEQAFREALRGAVAVQIRGTASERATAAARARQLLNRAEACIPLLPAARQAQARLFVGVRRVQVDWDEASTQSVRAAARRGQEVRSQALREGVWKTYYRTQLLVLLWRSMDELDFRRLLDDGAGDRDWLFAPATLEALQRTGGSLKWLLQILRADLQLELDPGAAQQRLRELAGALGRAGGAGALALRDECHSRLAWHALELRDYRRARLFLDLLPRARTRYPRAVIAYRQGDLDFATAEAEALVSAEPAFAHLLLWANAGEALAWQRRALGEPADPGFVAALGGYRRAAGAAASAAERAAAHNGEGDCHLALAQLGEARRAYQRALEELQGLTSSEARVERAETFKDLGRLAEREAQLPEARRAYLRSLALVEELRREIPYDLLGISWLEPGPGLQEAVDGLLRLQQKGAVSAAEALAAVDRMKARGLLDWMTQPPQPGDLDAYRGALRRMLRSRDFGGMRRGQLALDRLRAAAGARQAAPVLEPGEVAKVVRGLGDTVLLSYWAGHQAGDPQVFVGVAGGGQAARILALGSLAEIRPLAVAARRAVVDPSVDPWPALDALAAAVLPEALQRLCRPERRLLVCPDSQLGWLPFAALRIAGQALGVRCRLHALPSLAVHQVMASRQQEIAQVLLLDSVPADPELDARYDLSPLSFSDEEAHLVRAAWPAAQRLSGAAASLARLRARRGVENRASLLHINCHAVRDARLPAASLLLLADGAVDMGSFAQLPLAGDCVVFSACATGGIYAEGGEGLKGLLWGPFGAGAQAVLASQWPVNQQATKDLMGQFHAHLARGADVAEAMRAARARLAAAANYRHPAFWAGFSVYARPTLVAVRVGLGQWLWLALGLVAGLSLWLGLRRSGRRASLPGQ